MTDSIKETVNKIDEMRKIREWDQFHSIKNLAISLNLEASEILEKFQWNRDEKLTEKETNELHDELADVFINTVFLALELDVDLLEITENKIKKIDIKYPAEKVRGISKREMYETGSIKKEVHFD